MPRKARSPEEVLKARQSILDQALELISEEGYNDFSMRKLANRLDMTATTIYQYFANKDELYLAVLQEGFELLYEELDHAVQKAGDPLEQLTALTRAFVDLGIGNPNFYNIMLVNDVPKYYDYVGSSNEGAAAREMEAALKVRNFISTRVLESGVLDGRPVEDTMPVIIHFFCTVHGFVAFRNSQITDYLYGPDPEAINDTVIDQFVAGAIDQMRYGKGM